MSAFSIHTPGRRPAILMCAPDHFAVDYVINPWMEDQVGKSHHAEAVRQWNGLHKALAKEADLHLVPPAPKLPDFVFTANAALVCGKTAILSRFRTQERRPEEPFYRAWFEAAGYDIAPWPDDVSFEGAGDALFDRGQPLLWLAHGFRSDPRAHALLEKAVGMETLSLRLADPRFYHLDTCLCPLEGGYLLYYPAAFAPESAALIESRIPAEKRIAVGEDDALGFACNAVDLNRHVFTNRAGPGLQARLAAAGFKTVVTPLDEFLKAGGAAKCLTLKLVEPCPR